MSEQSQELAIDIGGGEGRYFLKRAKQEPDKTFLILDTGVPSLKDKPPNLQFVQWKSDKDWSLPLKANSVDEVNINFLFSVLTNSKGESFRLPPEEIYRRLIRQVKEVLKSGALVNIVDTEGNIDEIVSILEEEGYTITTPPISLEDTDRTKYAEQFSAFDIYSRSEHYRPLRDLKLLPMEIKAQYTTRILTTIAPGSF